MEKNNDAAEANNLSAEAKTATADEQNPSNSNINNNSVDENVSAVIGDRTGAGVGDGDGDVAGDGRRSRRQFTDLSQVDADLALARTLQEQERAYMMLSMNSNGIHFGSWEAANYTHDDDGEDEDLDDPSEEEYDGSDGDEDEIEEEDAFDVHAHAEASEDEYQGIVLDPSAYSSDEAYARALQDAEEREMAARLLALAGISEAFVGDDEDDDDDIDDDDDDDDDHGGNSQDAWEEVDPDEMSYEELIALGEVVGTESRGLSADTIASLPSVNYKSQSSENGNSDSCVICRCDFEDDETLTALSCKHLYHSECINNWLCQNKVCPICNAEVSTSGSS